MSAHRRLSDEQIDYVKRVTAQRRQAMEVVKQFPTNAQLAAELKCSERVIDKYSTCAEAVCSTRNNEDRYHAHITEAEFAELMRTE